MKNKNKTPCTACQQVECDELNCARYRKWFLCAWEDINRYAWSVMDKLGKETAFRYELPHERLASRQDPCQECPCREWCDTPCSMRLAWWNRKMAELRRDMTTDKAALEAY